MEMGLKIFKKILDIIMTIIIVIGSILVILYLFGIKPYVVLSGSMAPNIPTGSVCFINEKARYESMKVDDIIAFKISTGASVTHRIVNITEKGFETKGDANEEKDGTLTTKQNFLGKNLFSIKGVGRVVDFIQSTKGRIIIFTIIIFVLAAGFLIGDSNNKKNILEDYLDESEDLITKKDKTKAKAEKNKTKNKQTKDEKEHTEIDMTKEETSDKRKKKNIKHANNKKVRVGASKGKRYK